MKSEKLENYKKVERIEDIQLNPKNHNKGTERGNYAVEQSIRRLGAGRSGVIDVNGKVIAGNHTAQAIADLGIPIKVVPTRGDEWILVQRIDLNIDKDKKATELAYADNRVSELNFQLDVEQLAEDLEQDLDLSYLYTENEIEHLTSQLELPEDNLDIDEDKMKETKHTCPNCGHRW